MSNLKTLKLSDNFDVWRDIINSAIGYLGDIPDVPDMSTSNLGFILSNELDENGEYVLKWKNLADMLNDLGIDTGGEGGGQFPTIGSYLPDGLTVGTTGYTYVKPNGDIENSGNIISHGDITSDNNILANKITSKTSLNSQNLELTAQFPYIDFNYDNTSSDYTSRIIENKSGVLTINGNDFSENGSSIRSDLRVFTPNNDVVFRNDDRNFYILFSGRNGTPNSLRPLTIDIATGKVTMDNGVSSSSIECSGNTSLNGPVDIHNNITVDGESTLSGNSLFQKDVTIEGTLYVDTIDVENIKLDLSSLEISPNIKAGPGSAFDSDVYINGTEKSLVLRNNDTAVYFLISESLNGEAINSLRPFSFEMGTGNVNMAHTVTIGDTLTVTGKATFSTAFVNTLQTYDSTGKVFNVISNGKVFSATFNDYAEFFEKGEETEPGDIIGLDVSSDREQYIKANDPDLIVGVHSDSYGCIVGGEKSIEDSSKKYIPVGLSGRVRAKVIGKVKKGDKITLSSISGIGIKASETAQRTIGFCLEDNADENIKLVKIKLL